MTLTDSRFHPIYGVINPSKFGTPGSTGQRQRSKHKVKQQERIVLLAVFLLKHRYRELSSKTKQICGFATKNKLIHVPPEDEERKRSTGQSVWENDLAYRLKSLKGEGLLTGAPGVWELTEAGERDMIEWAGRIKLKIDDDPNCAEGLRLNLADPSPVDHYLTPEAVEWGRKIALGEVSYRGQ